MRTEPHKEYHSIKSYKKYHCCVNTTDTSSVHQTQTFTILELDDIPVGKPLTQRITELNKPFHKTLPQRNIYNYLIS